MNIICWLQICQYGRTGVERETESARQMGGGSGESGPGSAVGESKTGSRAMVVGRRPSLWSIFWGGWCIESWECQIGWEKKGALGRRERTLIEHLWNTQELSRVLHTQICETALLSCLYLCVTWGPKWFSRYIVVINFGVNIYWTFTMCQGSMLNT